jgi:signal transduction histidine kinase
MVLMLVSGRAPNAEAEQKAFAASHPGITSSGAGNDSGPNGGAAYHPISALGEMTAGLAHDFRTILAIIQSGLNVARRAEPDSPNWEVAVSAIDEAIRRGKRLTGELLVFARGGKPDVHTENVNQLLTGAITFIRYGAGVDIQITLDLASSLPECRIDPAQFNAAILNLVVNARDAMPNGGEISISTDECGEPCGDIETSVKRWVRVRIADQGSGMPPEVLEHLFDPYFTTKWEADTGLGVPQVVAFMRASGGTVCVSTEPGAGTCFDLRFPAADQPGLLGDNLWRQLDRWTNEGGNSQPPRFWSPSGKVDRSRNQQRQTAERDQKDMS